MLKSLSSFAVHPHDTDDDAAPHFIFFNISAAAALFSAAYYNHKLSSQFLFIDITPLRSINNIK
jgi:hypothetical protein